MIFVWLLLPSSAYCSSTTWCLNVNINLFSLFPHIFTGRYGNAAYQVWKVQIDVDCPVGTGDGAEAAGTVQIASGEISTLVTSSLHYYTTKRSKNSALSPGCDIGRARVNEELSESLLNKLDFIVCRIRSNQYSAVDGGIHDEFGDVTHLDSRYRCRNNLFILYNKALKYYSINSLSNWKSRVSRTTFILQYHSQNSVCFWHKTNANVAHLK